MNARNLRPANTAAATLFIGGWLVLLFPEHALSIVRLVIVTIAATAGLYALAVNSPPAWGSPFLRGARRRGGRDAGEVAWIRARLWGWRHWLGPSVAMPAEVQRMLRPLIVAALQRQGIDPDDARDLLSPLSWAVLTGPPRGQLGGLLGLPPDRRHVTALVHRVMDDLEGLSGGGAVPATRGAASTRP